MFCRSVTYYIDCVEIEVGSQSFIPHLGLVDLVRFPSALDGVQDRVAHRELG